MANGTEMWTVQTDAELGKQLIWKWWDEPAPAHEHAQTELELGVPFARVLYSPDNGDTLFVDETREQLWPKP